MRLQSHIHASTNTQSAKQGYSTCWPMQAGLLCITSLLNQLAAGLHTVRRKQHARHATKRKQSGRRTAVFGCAAERSAGVLSLVDAERRAHMLSRRAGGMRAALQAADTTRGLSRALQHVPAIAYAPCKPLQQGREYTVRMLTEGMQAMCQTIQYTV